MPNGKKGHRADQQQVQQGEVGGDSCQQLSVHLLIAQPAPDGSHQTIADAGDHKDQPQDRGGQVEASQMRFKRRLVEADADVASEDGHRVHVDQGTAPELAQIRRAAVVLVLYIGDDEVRDQIADEPDAAADDEGCRVTANVVKEATDGGPDDDAHAEGGLQGRQDGANAARELGHDDGGAGRDVGGRAQSLEDADEERQPHERLAGWGMVDEPEEYDAEAGKAESSVQHYVRSHPGYQFSVDGCDEEDGEVEGREDEAILRGGGAFLGGLLGEEWRL